MPLANEFQQKMAQQAKEIQEASGPTPSGPKEHPEDTMIVENILVNDSTEVEEVIPYATPRNQSRDPRTPTQFDFNRLDSNLYEHHWNTKDFFEVRWDGRPHRIKPGEKRFLPRYLADHFAKALIDFILTRREEKERLRGLVKNRMERAKLYKQIIVGVASYYNGDAFDSEREGFRIERQVDEMNRTSNVQTHDIGEAVNPALGYGTTDKPPEKLEEDDTPATPKPATAQPVSNPQDLVANKSRQELMKEAKNLGLEVTTDMTKDQLSTMILNF